MLNLDALNQLKQLKEDIHASRNLHQGVVRGSGQKFGFVRLDSGKDIYLPATEMERVLPGDRVEVEVKKEAKNKTYAVLERLITEGVSTFAGRYVVKGNAHFVEPDLPGFSNWIFIPPNKRAKAKAGDLLLCKLLQHPYKEGKAQAQVTEVIGQGAGIAWDYVIRKNALPMTWSKGVERELEGLDEALVEQIAATRQDLTQLPLVTIDAKSTVDLDDALYAEVQGSDFRLWVAIADPVALVKPGSALEKAVLERGTSVYLPGQHIPMIPPVLSSGLASLAEGQKRLAKVAHFVLASDGTVQSFDLTDAVICSRHKLAYDDVTALLTSEAREPNAPVLSDEILTSLRTLDQIRLCLRQARDREALVGAERQDYYLELDESRRIKSIKAKTPTIAHQIVEEAMILVNRSIAERLQQSGQASLFVAHAGVREDRREILQGRVNALNLDVEQTDVSTLSGFVTVSKALSQNEQYRAWYALLTRQLEKSQLSVEPKPHFGMGLAAYTTFTSPLRKALDFMVHRQLSESVSKPIPAKSCDALEETLARARNAQTELEQWLKCEFMEHDKNAYEARVLRVFATGVQVRLSQTGVEGTIDVRELPGKFSFNNELMTLVGDTLRFELDQVLLVRVKQVNWPRKQIYFEVVSESV